MSPLITSPNMDEADITGDLLSRGAGQRPAAQGQAGSGGRGPASEQTGTQGGRDSEAAGTALPRAPSAGHCRLPGLGLPACSGSWVIAKKPPDEEKDVRSKYEVPTGFWGTRMAPLTPWEALSPQQQNDTQGVASKAWSPAPHFLYSVLLKSRLKKPTLPPPRSLPRLTQPCLGYVCLLAVLPRHPTRASVVTFAKLHSKLPVSLAPEMLKAGAVSSSSTVRPSTVSIMFNNQADRLA